MCGTGGAGSPWGASWLVRGSMSHPGCRRRKGRVKAREFPVGRVGAWGVGRGERAPSPPRAAPLAAGPAAERQGRTAVSGLSMSRPRRSSEEAPAVTARTGSEDNLYLAVLRAAEGRKGTAPGGVGAAAPLHPPPGAVSPEQAAGQTPVPGRRPWGTLPCWVRVPGAVGPQAGRGVTLHTRAVSLGQSPMPGRCPAFGVPRAGCGSDPPRRGDASGQAVGQTPILGRCLRDGFWGRLGQTGADPTPPPGSIPGARGRFLPRPAWPPGLAAALILPPPRGGLRSGDPFGVNVVGAGGGVRCRCPPLGAHCAPRFLPSFLSSSRTVATPGPARPGCATERPWARGAIRAAQHPRVLSWAGDVGCGALGAAWADPGTLRQGKTQHAAPGSPRRGQGGVEAAAAPVASPHVRGVSLLASDPSWASGWVWHRW